ncbi:MAG TPA: oligosaccharide flippase family protein [Beijerinckiaceae bacterium]|nr:oligosaccharide flippase family protein [Beijerinckiaceae bacterium]
MAESLRRQGATGSRLIGWLGWAGLDALGRLALLTGSTVVFSRLLGAHEFGVSALVLAIVAAASLFVGAPFEEALTRQRGLRRRHLRAALGVSWVAAIVLIAASGLAGRWLATVFGEPEIALLLPVTMVSIVFSAHSDIMTALARRLKRFNDVAYATLMGHVIGICLALGLAFAGFGIWALIGQRVLVVLARAILLQRALGYLILPLWSPADLRGLGRFAGLSFLSRLTENLGYLAFNAIVQVIYGTQVLGHVNMAMRLIEPIRGAILATGHNLAFSYFARSPDRHRLRERARDVVAKAALVTVPAFVGLAVVAPDLIPMMAGPGWEPAIALAICLSLASALAVPSALVYTAFSAAGRPEHSLASLVLGLISSVIILVVCAPLGPISVGLSRLAGDGLRALCAVVLPAAHLGWTRLARLDALAHAWLLSALMGLVTILLAAPAAAASHVLSLAIAVLLGVAVYALLLVAFARSRLAEMARLAGIPVPGFLERT